MPTICAPTGFPRPPGGQDTGSVVPFVVPPDDRLDVPRELDPSSISIPQPGCILMVSNSGGVSGPGLLRISWAPHLAEVVEIRAESHRRQILFIEPQRPRPPPRRSQPPARMAERVAVGRFDRVAPLAHDGEVRLFEAATFGRRRPPGPAARRAGRTGGAPRSGSAARPDCSPSPGTGGPAHARPRPAQHRSGIDRELDRCLEPRFREREAARFPVDHLRGPCRRRPCLVGAPSWSKMPQRRLRVSAGLPRTAGERGGPRNGSAGRGRWRCTSPDAASGLEDCGRKKPCRFLPLSAIGAHHAEVVIGDRPALLVTGPPRTPQASAGSASAPRS